MRIRAILSAVLAGLCVPAFAVEQADIAARLSRMTKPHPRLFLPAGGEKDLARRLAADPARVALRDGLLKRAEAMLSEKPVERIVTGRRLLSESRRALGRVLHLGLAWRLTGDRRFADRARAEMLSAAAFSDWNPSHFLDTAEMTMALGIGYDWFYSFLSEADRKSVRDAIVEKGLKAGVKVDHWSRAIHNWNQVCNAGMAVGALAVAESEPEMAAMQVTRAINTVTLAMHEYGPDGAYPEGAGYWSYGTTFNVILLSALESTLGTDFDLSNQPGFLATADFYLHIYGPTGEAFNYSDAGSGRAGLSSAMFWLARTRREPYLLWTEWSKLDALRQGSGGLRGDRADAFLPLWMPPDLTRPKTPPALSWTGHGITPVAFHRSSWDADASFVAIKGGSPSANHAHMDIGAFVMDADGVRWADDLGSQEYNSLESKGIDLWGKGQNAGRWKVFRLGTSAHNVLMVNGEQQRVEGKAPIVLSKPGRTVVDLSTVYQGQLTAARRGAELRSDRTVLIQDEFTAPSDVNVRWAMLTKAEVKIDGEGRATLTREGKSLRFRVVEPAGAALKIYATDPPPAATDAANPGTRMLGFETRTAGGRIVVHLVPQSAKDVTVSPRALQEW